MMKAQPSDIKSSLSDVEYDDRDFNHSDVSKRHVDVTDLSGHLTQSHYVKSQRSKVEDDTSPIPIAICLTTSLFECNTLF